VDGGSCMYILGHMKQILIELDDRCARELGRLAPPKKRMRAEFIRLAIRRAIDLALDRATERAYRGQPLTGEMTPGDLAGWDALNELAQARPKRAARPRGAKSAA
jgi:hypothetical protein